MQDEPLPLPQRGLDRLSGQLGRGFSSSSGLLTQALVKVFVERDVEVSGSRRSHGNIMPLIRGTKIRPSCSPDRYPTLIVWQPSTIWTSPLVSLWKLEQVDGQAMILVGVPCAGSTS